MNYTTTRNKLNPHFVTGFCDAESCLYLNISKNPLFKTGWRIRLVFSIHLHSLDINLLYKIQSFFGVGNVTLHGDSAVFSVTNVEAIGLIIEHFKQYPLKTQKYADFLLFQKAYEIIIDQRHLTISGLHELISIRASINKGLPERLKLAFQSIIPVVRPEVPKFSFDLNNSDIKYWVAGFITGEGCFHIQTSKSKTHKLGISVSLTFYVSQHIRDSYLLACFEQLFGCGSHSVVTKSGIAIFTVRNIPDLTDKIIPFFSEFQLQGVKAREFNDFKEASILIKSKLHLTKVGLDKIVLIKSRMNFHRK